MNTAEKTLGQGFIYGDDLLRDGRWHEQSLVIAEVIPAGTIKGADRTIVDKPALRFEGAKKLLVVNATNSRILKVETGNSNPKGWTGKEIVIYPAKIRAFGEETLCVRIRNRSGRPLAKGVRKWLGTDLTEGGAE